MSFGFVDASVPSVAWLLLFLSGQIVKLNHTVGRAKKDHRMGALVLDYEISQA